jgi:hypothetical protein
MGTTARGKGRWKEDGRMRTVIDSGLYLDSGLISGLEAMSEMRELLDEIYGEALPEIPDEE